MSEAEGRLSPALRASRIARGLGHRSGRQIAAAAAPAPLWRYLSAPFPSLDTVIGVSSAM